MSQLTPAERKAFARALLRLFDRFADDLASVCIKHETSPALFDGVLELDGLKRELQAELDRP